MKAKITINRHIICKVLIYMYLLAFLTTYINPIILATASPTHALLARLAINAKKVNPLKKRYLFLELFIYIAIKMGTTIDKKLPKKLLFPKVDVE